ncbi:MAG: helix-turn-helix domain-containing protein [Betaproteobacteria bacterium]
MSSSFTKYSTFVEEISPVSSVEDFGRILREMRKAQKLTIHDAAGLAGVSVQFLHDLESGKPSIQMGRALNYASMLGLGIAALKVREPTRVVPETNGAARPM